MPELLANPLLHDVLKTAGPASLLGMMGWVAWWYERKDHKETQRMLFKTSSAQIQSNTRLEAAVKALRELVRERLLDR